MHYLHQEELNSLGGYLVEMALSLPHMENFHYEAVLKVNLDAELTKEGVAMKYTTGMDIYMYIIYVSL